MLHYNMGGIHYLGLSMNVHLINLASDCTQAELHEYVEIFFGGD